jgi:hypothetical protein
MSHSKVQNQNRNQNQNHADWGSFETKSPTETILKLGVVAERNSAFHHILMMATEKSLRYTNIQSDRFKYLTNMAFVKLAPGNIQVRHDSKRLMSVQQHVHKAYVIMVSLVDTSGEARCAVLWIEDAVIEVFYPFSANQERMYMNQILEKHVIPFLGHKWLKTSTPIIKLYTLPRVWASSNYWVEYFVLLRARSSSMEEAQRLFSDASSYDSLLDNRDVVVQTLGKGIERCFMKYHGNGQTPITQFGTYFGKNATRPVEMTLDNVTTVMPNGIRRCTMSGTTVWEPLQEIIPTQAQGEMATEIIWKPDTDQKWKPFIPLPNSSEPYFPIG